MESEEPTHSLRSVDRRRTCLNCRQKRMTCDRDRPGCGQCARSRDKKPCVYDDNPLKRTAVLQNKIKTLEDQISLLETSKRHVSTRKPPPPSDSSSASTSVRSMSTGPQSEASSPPSSLHSDAMSAELTIPPKLETSSALLDEPSPALIKHLVGVFLMFRHHVFFEHHLPRLLRRLDLPSSHPDAIHPCLINAFCLVGTHYSKATHGKYEAVFLARTRHELNESLSLADKLFDFIVASVLLARWYAYTGRLVEAYNQSSSVAQFAVSCGLDKLSSPCTAEAPPSILDRPRDLIELGERISTFWNIFVADRFIALSSGFATTIDVDTVMTIWPLQIDTLQDLPDLPINRPDTNPRSVSHLFSIGDVSLSVVHDNIFTLPVKTIALLDRSALLASRARALASAIGPHRGVDENLQRELEEMKTCIRQFHSTLAPINDMSGIYRDITIAAAAVTPDMMEDAITNGLRNSALFPPSASGSGSGSDYSTGKEVVKPAPQPDSKPPQRVNAVMVCSQTAVYGALMELHNVPAPYVGFGETEKSSRAKMMEAARCITEIARATVDLEAASLGVSVGLTWVAAADILIRRVQALNLARLYAGESFDTSDTKLSSDSTVAVSCTSHFPAQSDEIGCTRQQIRWLVHGVKRISNVHGLFVGPAMRLESLENALG